MKKIVALLLCLVMMVGALSTVAVAEEKAPTAAELLAAIYDEELLPVQEYAIAAGIQKTLKDFAKNFDGKIVDEDGNPMTADQYADVLFGIYKATVEEKFVATGDYKADMKAFVAASIAGYQAAGAEFMADRTEAAIAELLAGVVKSLGGEVDEDLMSWIASLS